MHTHATRGMTLVPALIMIAVLSLVMLSYATMTLQETRAATSSARNAAAFHAAEGGLNLRADAVRTAFQGFSRPTGTSPATLKTCTTGQGTGDMACINYTFGPYTVSTAVQDITPYVSGAAPTGTVPPGDTYSGLSYQGYTYQVTSTAHRTTSETNAQVNMRFISRLIPIFQFAAFYNGDLELHPGVALNINGRLHSNSNLYLNGDSGANVTVTGKATAAGSVYRYGKDLRSCNGTYTMSGRALPCNAPQNAAFTPTQLLPFNGTVVSGTPALTLPAMSDLAPGSAGDLWQRADVRIVATQATPRIGVKGNPGYVAPTFTLKVVTGAGLTDATATARLAACNVAAPTTVAVRGDTFWDNREATWMSLIDVDQVLLMNCLHGGGFTADGGAPLTLADTSGGGLALHFSFQDGLIATNTTGATNYGVKVRNAARLGASTSGAPAPTGVTFITNQALYSQGDVNTVRKIPTAFMADAVNILSNAATADIPLSGPGVDSTYGPPATSTTVNAAMITGVVPTVPGVSYSGGLQNFVRLHENWRTPTQQTLTITGSMVSFGTPLHQPGPYSRVRYNVPQRNFTYDTSFNTFAGLPPLTPRVVSLRQQLFARDW